MSLYTRLIGLESPKIPVHQFMAALGEIERGKLTEGNVSAAFGLSAGEQTELASLVTRIRTPLEGYPLNGRVTLTNVGAAYDTNIDSQSLPFIYLQQAGITRVDIELRVRKVGTGNQDWQLWSDTDGVAAIGPGALTTGSLTDSAAAGDHTLSASRTFGSPLAAGVKKYRLRCQSSVAADDPVFLQGAILIFRVDKMTSVELHEVLCLAEHGDAYTTEVALKARLGV